MRLLGLVLLIAAVAVWSYLIGTFSNSVEEFDTLPALYDEYNTIRMFEDGTYVAETKSGYQVSGCIEGAVCND